MHESQLARRVLDVVLARAREAGAVRVRTVHGRLGELEALGAAALAFHLHHVEARCRACARVYLPDHVLLCPACGSTDGDLLGEVGLVVESLEVDDGA
jgi:hydrogenase nickel incorporation protein HypA/HybF